LRPRRLKRAAVALALAGLALGPPRAEAAKSSERLERLRVEIEEREARARDFAQQADGYLGELEAVDRELTELRRSLRRLRREERAAEKNLRQAEVALERAARELDQSEKMLENRLVALYKFGRAGGVPALYSARDFQGFVQRSESLGRILEADSRVFEQHREARAAWSASRESSRALVEELRAAQREAAAREERVRRKLVERRNLVGLLRSRSDREHRAAEELRVAAQRLEEALEDMPSEFRPSAAGALTPGRLLWPADGRVRLGFGRQLDPEFGTETVRNGVEIQAPAGAPVLAVADGRVLFSGWFRGYGQVVILDHGEDRLTVSGFLDELSVDAGDEVRKGETIGTVGETGSLSGPGLYFEIRHQGRPVDPVTWLQ
jgi:septal ring factor EnvC (AmiA/AmiB activator)